jgi:hypothetical protein
MPLSMSATVASPDWRAANSTESTTMPGTKEGEVGVIAEALELRCVGEPAEGLREHDEPEQRLQERGNEQHRRADALAQVAGREDGDCSAAAQGSHDRLLRPCAAAKRPLTALTVGASTCDRLPA